MRMRLFILTTLVAMPLLGAEPPGAASDFAAANELYARGKFSDAAALYEKVLNSGTVSANLLFNDGNAEFKAGNLGRAIAAYRRAALLAPRDADIRANLDYARNQVQGATLRQPRWEDWLGVLTLNEWAGLTAMAFWLAFALFAAMQVHPPFKTALRGLARGVAVAAVLGGTCLAAAAIIHFAKPIAVVIAPDANARSGPFNDAQSAFALHNGAEVAVLERRNGWMQVSDASGRVGWLRDDEARFLPEI